MRCVFFDLVSVDLGLVTVTSSSAINDGAPISYVILAGKQCVVMARFLFQKLGGVYRTPG